MEGWLDGWMSGWMAAYKRLTLSVAEAVSVTDCRLSLVRM